MNQNRLCANPIVKNKKIEISGHVDNRFNNLAEIFLQNFTSRGENSEVGASVCITVDGETLVDIWGGYADSGENKLWQEDTICCCWSVSKTIPALLTLILSDRGVIDIEEPVAHYWPEFGEAGKEKILVKHLLNHTAGLSYVDAQLEEGQITDWDIMVSALEKTKPNWPAGEQIGYLNMTFGFLLGELCARVNGGKRLAIFSKEEISDPMNIDWHFALDKNLFSRVATVYQPKENLINKLINDSPESIFAKSMRGRNPKETYNSTNWRTAQNGSGTGHTNARAMAKLYGILANGGKFGKHKLISKDTLLLAMTETIKGEDKVNGLKMRFSSGFEMDCPPATPMGLSDSSFGYLGAGGSIAFADPEFKMGFGYSHNFMHQGIGPGPCGLPLLEEAIKIIKS